MGSDAVEAQGGVALLQQAIARERAVAVVESAAFFVLGDDEGGGREQRAAVPAEQAEREGVLLLIGVGRVQEDEVGGTGRFGQARKGRGDAARLKGVATANAERGEIGADGAQRRLSFFNEGGFAGAAAEGFDADGA